MSEPVTIGDATLLTGDVREVLRGLPAESVQCCITSPPYWGLRDYGTAAWEGGDAECDHVDDEKVAERNRQRKSMIATGERCDGSTRTRVHDTAIGKGWQYRDDCPKCGATRIDAQLGMEPTPELYVEHLVEVFREVRRVLRPDGTLWLNLGDSYAGGKGKSGVESQEYQDERVRSGKSINRVQQTGGPGQTRALDDRAALRQAGLKPKDLCEIPSDVVRALRADGWWLRSRIPWLKRNPMPESTTDRPTSAVEYIFLLTKSARYFYDGEAVRSKGRIPAGSLGGKASLERAGLSDKVRVMGVNSRPPQYCVYTGTRARRNSDWFFESWQGLYDEGDGPLALIVNPTAYKEAHFATFPPKLVEPMVKAGTSEKGCCPKCGKPWGRVVEKARKATRAVISTKIAGMSEPEYGNRDPERHCTQSRTLGWRPGCTCHLGGLRPDDLEVIATPTGDRTGPDPSLETGRAGMNRPRGDNEGQRPITRYEQRQHAAQLHESPHKEEMRAEAETLAFDHYLRVDPSGARPIPPDLLAKWLERGWLRSVRVPAAATLNPVPCTVLDPFSGAGTTAMVAAQLGRRAIGIDLSEKYNRMAAARIGKALNPSTFVDADAKADLPLLAQEGKAAE